MRGVLAALAVLASCVAATQAAAQGKPGYTCPAGITIGARLRRRLFSLSARRTRSTMGPLPSRGARVLSGARQERSGYSRRPAQWFERPTAPSAVLLQLQRRQRIKAVELARGSGNAARNAARPAGVSWSRGLLSNSGPVAAPLASDSACRWRSQSGRGTSRVASLLLESESARAMYVLLAQFGRTKDHLPLRPESRHPIQRDVSPKSHTGT